jgi:hypothetical protein
MTARRRQRPSQGATAVSRGSERDGRSQGSIRRPGGKRPRWRHGPINAAESDDEGFNASSGKRRRRRKTGHAGLAGRLLVGAAPFVLTTVHLAMINGHAGRSHGAGRGHIHCVRRRRRDHGLGEGDGPNQQQGEKLDQAGISTAQPWRSSTPVAMAGVASAWRRSGVFHTTRRRTASARCGTEMVEVLRDSTLVAAPAVIARSPDLTRQTDALQRAGVAQASSPEPLGAEQDSGGIHQQRLLAEAVGAASS